MKDEKLYVGFVLYDSETMILIDKHERYSYVSGKILEHIYKYDIQFYSDLSDKLKTYLHKLEKSKPLSIDYENLDTKEILDLLVEKDNYYNEYIIRFFNSICDLNNNIRLFIMEI